MQSSVERAKAAAQKGKVVSAMAALRQGAVKDRKGKGGHRLTAKGGGGGKGRKASGSKQWPVIPKRRKSTVSAWAAKQLPAPLRGAAAPGHQAAHVCLPQAGWPSGAPP